MSLIDFLKIAYVCVSILAVSSYFPMIYRMLKNADQTDSSIVSWVVWWISSIVGCLYSYTVVHDNLFLLTCVGHLIGTSIILPIQIFKIRRKNDR